MGKKDESNEPELSDVYVGADTDDDLADMEYPLDARGPSVDTHPPETKAEAEARADLTPKNPDQDAINRGDVIEEPAEEVAEEEEVQASDEVEEEEPAEEVEAKVDDEQPRIPKDRFDDVNNKRKAAEEEAEKLRKQLEALQTQNEEPAEPAYDYAAKDKEAVDAILEGDTERYDAIQEEIRTSLRNEILDEARKIARQEGGNVREELTFEETGAKIEQNYPEFSDESENYNEEARKELLELYVGYARAGNYTKAQALERAAEKTARIYGIKPVGQREEEGGLADKADNVVNMRQPDVKKKTKAANSQPPEMQSKARGVNEEPRIDFSSMSDEEFEALPEDTKRRARGDVV
jgi:hypothetical protein